MYDFPFREKTSFILLYFFITKTIIINIIVYNAIQFFRIPAEVEMRMGLIVNCLIPSPVFRPFVSRFSNPFLLFLMTFMCTVHLIFHISRLVCLLFFSFLLFTVFFSFRCFYIILPDLEPISNTCSAVAVLLTDIKFGTFFY